MPELEDNRALLREFRADPAPHAERVIQLSKAGRLEVTRADLYEAEAWIFDRQLRARMREVQGKRQARTIEVKRVAAQMLVWFKRTRQCERCRGQGAWIDHAAMDELRVARSRVECAECGGKGKISDPPQPGQTHWFHGGLPPRKAPAASKTTVVYMWIKCDNDGRPSLGVSVSESQGYELSTRHLESELLHRSLEVRMDSAFIWAEREAKRIPEKGELFKL